MLFYAFAILLHYLYRHKLQGFHNIPEKVMSAYAVLLSYLNLERNIIGKGLSASSRLQNAIVPQVNIIAVSEADITIYRALMSAGQGLHKYRFQRSCFSAILRIYAEAVIVRSVKLREVISYIDSLPSFFCSIALLLLYSNSPLQSGSHNFRKNVMQAG